MLIILCGFGVAVLFWFDYKGDTIQNDKDDINADDGDDVDVVFDS